VDAEDLAQVSSSLRRAVQDGDAGDVRRAVEEFGWHELLEEEAEAAVATLFALTGELLLPDTFLDHVLAAASGLELPEGVRVVLPHIGILEPTSTLERSEVSLDGVVQAGSGEVLLTTCLQHDKVVVATCTAPGPTDAAGTIDPAAGWVSIEGRVALGEVLAEGAEAAEVWDQMSAAGRRALAHELVAVGGEMLRLTLEHVTTREQFGQTLASFQVVKHKLADVYLWQQVATLSAEAAWEDRGGSRSRPCPPRRRGRTVASRAPRSPRRRPAGSPRPRVRTASSSSAAWASPGSTRSTPTCAGPSLSSRCSAEPQPSTGCWGTRSGRAPCPPGSPVCDAVTPRQAADHLSEVRRGCARTPRPRPSRSGCRGVAAACWSRRDGRL
jgi:hypothetical protein